MDTVWRVWKVPKDEIDTGEYHDFGVYPGGQLMGTCRTEEKAEEHAEMLEERSPSDRFDEQPYMFYVQGPVGVISEPF